MVPYQRATPLSKTLNELADDIRHSYNEVQQVVRKDPVWEPIRERVNAFHEELLGVLLAKYGHLKPSQNLLDDIRESLAKMAGVVAALNVTALDDKDAEAVHSALMEGLQAKMKEAVANLLGELTNDPEFQKAMGDGIFSTKPGKRDLN